MKILMTGGAGDLGLVLTPLLANRGDRPISFDIRPSIHPQAVDYQGSILNRDQLNTAMQGVDIVVHIAAWHGIHLVRGEKNAFDFWDLNVTGTFNVLETAVQNGIKNIVNISSTSIHDTLDIYGNSKVHAEALAQTYAGRHGCNIINLRPRAFIPYWNKATYPNYIEWAKWFWPGAVHIDDVAQAVIKSIDLLTLRKFDEPLTLTVDGAYDFSDEDLSQWDVDGPGTTFGRTYPNCTKLVEQFGLDPTIKPDKLDSKDTEKWLGYKPTYSLKNLLEELRVYGADGPPSPFTT
ncbi:MAG: nucleoside-diphosphate-sugar epimerase [Cellvibrionaceae bacterium]|jgi:nucleoside-diphosphate-sugar epimerase